MKKLLILLAFPLAVTAQHLVPNSAGHLVPVGNGTQNGGSATNRWGMWYGTTGSYKYSGIALGLDCEVHGQQAGFYLKDVGTNYWKVMNRSGTGNEFYIAGGTGTAQEDGDTWLKIDQTGNARLRGTDHELALENAADFDELNELSIGFYQRSGSSTGITPLARITAGRESGTENSRRGFLAIHTNPEDPDTLEALRIDSDGNVRILGTVTGLNGVLFGDDTLQTTAADGRLRVTSADTGHGFLSAKLVAGSNITITTNNAGGVESLTIAATGGGGGAGPTNLNFIAPLTIASGTNVSISANGVGNSLLRQSAGNSVIGRAVSSTGDVADITASADNTFMGRFGGALSFATIPSNITTQRVTVAKGGVTVGSRALLNFIEGANTTLTLADTGSQINVTVASTASGGGGTTYSFTSPLSLSGTNVSIAASTDNTYLARQGGVVAFYPPPIASQSIAVWGSREFTAATGDFATGDAYADVVFGDTTLQTDVLQPGTYLVTATGQFNQYRTGGQLVYVKLVSTETGADVAASERWAGPQNASSFQSEVMWITQAKITIATSGRVKVQAKNGISGDSISMIRHSYSSISWMRDTTVVDVLDVTTAVNSQGTFNTQDLVVTNAVTLGGVSRTSWPTGGSGSLKRYIYLYNPETTGGAGASKWGGGEVTGRAMFSGTHAATDNYALFNFSVPKDLDTSADLVLERFRIMLNAADTAAQTFTVSKYSAGNSVHEFPSTTSNPITVNVPADALGAQWDLESVADVTLTGWRSAIQPGQNIVLKVAREGNTDASSQASTLMALVISYTSTGN